MSTDYAELERRAAQWERFRAGRNKSLTDAHGWLSLTSFQWILATPAALAGVPGLWSFEGTTAFLAASAEDHLALVKNGETVVGTISAELTDEESLLWVATGSTVVELGMRAHRYMIRTRDAQSPTLAAFNGVPVFDYNPELVVMGRFEPYDAPRTEVIKTAHSEVPGSASLVGEVYFQLQGASYSLAAQEGAMGSLSITFSDTSNNVSTAPWRKIELMRPRPDGTVVVDFNRAINYPSAFSDFGTCPGPSAGNTLPVAIEAGERDPRK